jgi:predicted DNA-binding protein
MSRETINVRVSEEMKTRLTNLTHDLRMHTPSDLVRTILEEQLPSYEQAFKDAQAEKSQT